MKVYVVTQGAYSDYHICGVALTKEDAQVMAKRFDRSWDHSEIEEYDTTIIDDIKRGNGVYTVFVYNDGHIKTIKEQWDGIPACALNKWNYYPNGGYGCVLVAAQNEQAALKKARDISAQYMAKKEGI